MAVLLLLCGVQGSGKSTFARALSDRLAATVVATDAIRGELTGEYGGFVRSQSRLVMRIAKERVRSALASPGAVVIYDATNATPRARRPLVLLARRCAAAVAAGYFVVPLAVAIERVQRRTGQARVPVAAIREIYQRFEVPSPEEGFDWVFRADRTPPETFAPELQRLAAAPPGGAGDPGAPGPAG